MPDDDDLRMGELAIVVARHRKRPYQGLHEPALVRPGRLPRAGDVGAGRHHDRAEVGLELRRLLALAGELAGEYSGVPVKSLNRDQASRLLRSLQQAANEVNPDRLGTTDEDAFPGEYAREKAQAASRRADGSLMKVPVVVEVWADVARGSDEDSEATFMVNGSPCVAEVYASHEAKEKCTAVWGCGLDIRIKTGARESAYSAST